MRCSKEGEAIGTTIAAGEMRLEARIADLAGDDLIEDEIRQALRARTEICCRHGDTFAFAGSEGRSPSVETMAPIRISRFPMVRRDFPVAAAISSCVMPSR